MTTEDSPAAVPAGRLDVSAMSQPPSPWNMKSPVADVADPLSGVRSEAYESQGP